MKIMIIGVGKVGMALTQQLSLDGHDVTVIDTDKDVIDNIVNVYDVLGICGNGANYDIQREANAVHTDLLIATTSSDELNILACLVGKNLGVKHTIARVRNPDYEKQLRFMRDELGLSMAINPEKSTAREISRVLRFPNAVKLESFGKGKIELVEYRVTPDSALDGTRLNDLYRHIHIKLLICAVFRDNKTNIPSGDFVIHNGDTIYLTATPKDLENFFRKLGVFRNKATSVMIVGASNMSYYLASQLISMGMSVKIIDNDEKRAKWISEQLPKALVIKGDGTNTELLKEEKIKDTDAFVALTGIDEANILMCIVASKMVTSKVVAKVNNKALSKIVSGERLFDSVVSTGSVTAELILQYIRGMENASGTRIRTLHRLMNNKAEVLEFDVQGDVPFINTPLRQLKLKPELLIAGIVRQTGEIVIPSGSDSLQLNDIVIVVTTNKTLHDLNDIMM